MKKLSHLLLMLAAILFVVASCEGPMGPDGPMGPKGDKGDTGETGLTGDAGPEGGTTCKDCHDASGEISTIQGQWENSLHGMGENASYANRAGCAECHTNQGFNEFLVDGTTTAPYVDAQQPNCYTCHSIHETFTEVDLEVKGNSAQTLLFGGATFDKGNSNVCASCHQARAIDPVPVIDGAVVTLESRYGTHHGPVANMLIGDGFFEFPGVAYQNSMHSGISNACVSCHMSAPYSDDGGGHSMNMEYLSHESPTLSDKGCTECHTKLYRGAQVPGYALSDMQDFQTDVKAKLDELEGLLITIGVYDAGTELNVVGDFPANVAAAYVNYQSVKEDRSMGVHNPKYINALLDNTITAMEALIPAK